MAILNVLIILLNCLVLINSNYNHSIVKRSFLFPRATVLQFTYGISAPLILPRRSINLSICCQTNYDLPWKLSSLQTKIIQAKAQEGYDLSRLTFYNYITTILDSFGLDGEQCLLRTICEISEYPMHLEQNESLLEEIVHFIFTPSLEFSSDNTTLFSNQLLEAETTGKTHGKCWKLYDKCLVPLVSLFTAKYQLF